MWAAKKPIWTDRLASAWLIRRFIDPEAAGVETLLQEARRRSTSDAELLSESGKTFDLLLEAYYETTGKI